MLAALTPAALRTDRKHRERLRKMVRALRGLVKLCASHVDGDPMALRMLKLRRADVCAACARPIAVGSEALWDPVARTVTCIRCSAAGADPSALDRGSAGASVAREYERRKHQRETTTRQAHPHIGGLLLALREPPRHETAFRQGEQGEKAVAEALERRTVEGPAILLHDRRMPRGRGNIDHLAIAPSGVYVIDAKNYKGKVQVKSPLFGQAKLTIAGRNQTKVIDGLDRQLAAVRTALGGDYGDVPLHGVLCFTNADLPLMGTLKMRGHLLLYRKKLAKMLNADGPLSQDAIDALARTLAAALPSA